MRNIRQNLFLAFVYNLASIPIAARIVVSIYRLVAKPDASKCCDGFEFVVRRGECPANKAKTRCACIGNNSDKKSGNKFPLFLPSLKLPKDVKNDKPSHS